MMFYSVVEFLGTRSELTATKSALLVPKMANTWRAERRRRRRSARMTMWTRKMTISTCSSEIEDLRCDSVPSTHDVFANIFNFAHRNS